jgi:hypothetical protein
MLLELQSCSDLCDFKPYELVRLFGPGVVFAEDVGGLLNAVICNKPPGALWDPVYE